MKRLTQKAYCVKVEMKINGMAAVAQKEWSTRANTIMRRELLTKVFAELAGPLKMLFSI